MLVAELAEQGITTSTVSVWRLVRSEGLRFKKTLFAVAQLRPKIARRQAPEDVIAAVMLFDGIVVQHAVFPRPEREGGHVIELVNDALAIFPGEDQMDFAIAHGDVLCPTIAEEQREKIAIIILVFARLAVIQCDEQ